ncbi:LysE family translocator [candidate division KSB1 bacterium]|nr:LysE family translocator [candidate division KSB1 bacterium]
MISLSTLVLYTIGSIIIIISPGPDFLYVTTRGIAQGRKAGILSAAGISIGLLIHTGLAAFGLSAILNTSDIAFQTIKYIGAAYLLYLGVNTLVYGENLNLLPDSKNLNERSIIRQGIFTNVFNPKAIITFMAYIPQFVNPVNKNAAGQIIVLGAILAFLAIVWFGIVGFFAGIIGRWLSKHVFYQKLIRWFTGSVLVGLGLRLAVLRKTGQK